MKLEVYIFLPGCLKAQLSSSMEHLGVAIGLRFKRIHGPRDFSLMVTEG